MLTNARRARRGFSLIELLIVIAIILIIAAIAAPILRTPALNRVHDATGPDPDMVQKIGGELMSNYILPLEIIGLLLTAALLGAVVVAIQEDRSPGKAETSEKQALLAPTGEVK